jgi:hypothetical protein
MVPFLAFVIARGAAVRTNLSGLTGAAMVTIGRAAFIWIIGLIGMGQPVAQGY